MLLVACVLVVGVSVGSNGVTGVDGWRSRSSLHIAGDLVNLSLGRVIEGAVGIAAAGALLLYLLSLSSTRPRRLSRGSCRKRSIVVTKLNDVRLAIEECADRQTAVWREACSGAEE